MNPMPMSQEMSEWLSSVDRALRGARKRAEEIALRTKTAVVLVENGKTVYWYPHSGERRSTPMQD